MRLQVIHQRTVTAAWLSEGVDARQVWDERRDCRKLHKRLLQWYKDPRVTAAFQYTFREDDIFRTGLVTTALDRAFPVLEEWQAWGGSKRPDPTDPPPSHAHCANT